MFKYFVNFLKVLTSNRHPGEVAHAVSLGMLLGFVPKDNALWYILMVFFLFMRINRGTLLLSALVFSLISPLLDPLFDTAGWWLLNLEGLKPAFSALLDIPFVGFTKFNNTIVAGSLLCSLFLYVPVYLLARLFTRLWRQYLAPAVRKTRLISLLSKLPVVAKIGEMI